MIYKLKKIVPDDGPSLRSVKEALTYTAPTAFIFLSPGLHCVSRTRLVMMRIWDVLPIAVVVLKVLSVAIRYPLVESESINPIREWAHVEFIGRHLFSHVS